MKITFVCKTLNASGGIERATTLLANTLSRRGHRVSLVSWLGCDGTPFFDIDPDIEVRYLLPRQDKAPAIIRDIRRFVLMRRCLRNLKPDVVVLSGLYHSIINIPAAKGFNVVSWEHSALSRRHRHLITRLARRLSARYSQCVVTTTAFDAEGYQRIYKAKHVRVIPNALTLKESEASPLDNNVVLAVGRFEKVKGHDLLLEAWSQMEPSDWTLRIVGGGKLLAALQEQVREKQIKQVEFLPSTPQIAEHYRQASLYALCSRSENFPLVLLEAMYMGLPCVSFDCGPGPREIIRHGESGLIVPPQDTVAMAQALQTLMARPELRTQMGEVARELSQQYQMDHIVPQWEAVLQEAVDTETQAKR